MLSINRPYSVAGIVSIYSAFFLQCFFYSAYFTVLFLQCLYGVLAAICTSSNAMLRPVLISPLESTLSPQLPVKFTRLVSGRSS